MKTNWQKFMFVLFTLVLVSCSETEMIPDDMEVDFITTAKRFHELYITAGDCTERNNMIDKELIFFENRQPFTYEDVLEYCSYIKPKNAFTIFTKQYLVQPTVGFDYVDQYYLNAEQDTLRETTSRIWQFKSGTWVVTHMQVSRQAK